MQVPVPQHRSSSCIFQTLDFGLDKCRKYGQDGLIIPAWNAQAIWNMLQIA